MRYKLHYGKDEVEVETEERVEILLPNEVEVGDEAEAITKGLANPIGAGNFEDFAAHDKSLLVVVNDATRPTPTAQIIEAIYPILANHPDVKFIIATGAHRAPTHEEYLQIFGRFYDELSDRIHSHDAKEDEMVNLGTSQAGTEMYINRMVTDADNVLVIGSVEPHYFAGYTGGRKSFLPGLASFETIEMNHRHALSNRARTLALDGNAVHEDMIDALENLKELNIYSIQTVLTGDHRIFSVKVGELHQSFYAAVEEANKIYCVPVSARANIVVTVALHPMDIDLYQSQKAIDNAKFALGNGGILILVARCASGIGGKTFFDLLSACPTPQEVLYKINKEYKLGYHKAAKLAQIGVWAEMWAVTELADEELESVHIVPKGSVQGAVDEAVTQMRERDKEPKLVLMPNGCLTVPVLEGVDITRGYVHVKTDLGIEDAQALLEVVLES